MNYMTHILLLDVSMGLYFVHQMREDDYPSTACQQSKVCAPGGVPLGRGTPGQQPSPGGRRG